MVMCDRKEMEGDVCVGWYQFFCYYYLAKTVSVDIYDIIFILRVLLSS